MEEIIIQIIEDDRLQCDQLERFLHEHTFRTITHPTAYHALDWLQAHRPDLAVLDINLEEDGIGYGVLNVLSRKEVPTIVLTSRKSVSNDQLASIYSGALTYMRKPYNPDMMLMQINNILHVVKPLRHVFENGSNCRQITERLWLDASDGSLIDQTQEPPLNVRLTGRHFHLAKVFLVEENRPVSREKIVEYLWAGKASMDTLYSTITRFNRVLQDAGSSFRLENVYRSTDAFLSEYKFVYRDLSGM